MHPHHIAIIPDGNRRWAQEKGLKNSDGHTEGVRSLRTILDEAIAQGVTYLSAWGTSRDNVLKRSVNEVRFLFKLFLEHFNDLLTSETITKNQVRVRVIGEWRDYFPAKLKKTIDELQEKTKKFSRHHLTFLMAYDGRREMLAAINEARKISQPVNEKVLRKLMWTGELPPVDLVIRTGGEPHWSSGFMMWNTADAEFYFTRDLWPDFKEKQFAAALAEFEKRRRMGGG